MKNEMEILYGGADLAVRVVVEGKIEVQTIKVRKVSFREIPQLGAAFGNGDMPAEAALYAGKPTDWIEAVEPEDAFKILSEGRRLNASVFPQLVTAANERIEILRASQKDAPSGSQSSSSS